VSQEFPNLDEARLHIALCNDALSQATVTDLSVFYSRFL
jgi:hypothetical protein